MAVNLNATDFCARRHLCASASRLSARLRYDSGGEDRPDATRLQRIDSQQGWISPWAQLSYHYLLADTPQNSRREATNGTDQSEGIDLSIGAQVPLNDNLAAFAAFSQSEALNNQEQQLYTFGFSASF